MLMKCFQEDKSQRSLACQKARKKKRAMTSGRGLRRTERSVISFCFYRAAVRFLLDHHNPPQLNAVKDKLAQSAQSLQARRA